MKISVLIPTFNEVGNVGLLVERITEILKPYMARYDYEIVITDNCSSDGTRELLRRMAGEDPHIKVILNTRNFLSGSGMNGLRKVTGDCCIHMAADFQDPPEMIPAFIEAWEEGYKAVLGVKHKSKTNPLMHFIRGRYYAFMNKVCSVEQIEQFSGFALYDRKILDTIKEIQDPLPYLRGIIAEYGYNMKRIEYTQQARYSGTSSNNFSSLYRISMRGLTSYSSFLAVLPRNLAVIVALLSLVLLAVCLAFSQWILGVVLVFVGLLAALVCLLLSFVMEYLFVINKRVMNYPTVVEEELLNFEESL